MSLARALVENKQTLVKRILAPSPRDTLIAVESGDLRLTYRELREAVAKGSGRQGLAIIERSRSPGFVIDFLAVLAAGGIPVPIDPGIPAARRALLLDQIAGHEVGQPDASYVFFTSGSTGLPRPVLGTARGLHAFISWQSREFKVGPGDRVAFLTPVGFDVALRDMLLPLWSGATLVIPAEGEATSPGSTVDWLCRRRISIVHAVPSVAKAWLRSARGTSQTLRAVFFAGEPLTEDLLRDWMAVFPATRDRVNLYGPTETTLAKFYRRFAADEPVGDTVPVGNPLPGTGFCLLAPGDTFDVQTVRRRIEHPLPEGEIVIVTPHAGHGYLGMPAATRERFLSLEDGVKAYRTGDLGRRLGKGELAVIGRADDEVKIGGVRIHPAEVAGALRRHAGVSEAHVTAVAVGDGYQLVAHVVPANGGLSEVDLMAHTASELPAAMAPARIVQHAEFPMLRNGKVDRAALARSAQACMARADHVAPAGDKERWVAGRFATLLGQQRVSAEDDLFSLGGTSMFAMQLAADVRQRYGVELTAADVLRLRTPREVARHLDRAPASREAIPPIDRSGGRLPMSLAQHRLYFLQQVNPTGAAYNIAQPVRIRGHLDPDRLVKALRELVLRHEVLRTVCVTDGDEPELVISTQDVEIELVSHPADLTELAMRPFDLDAHLPLRATLIRRSHVDHVLLLVVHHIACDEWSMQRLLHELFAIYAGGAPRSDPVQYADFAAWQRASLTEDVLHEHLQYWREQLAGMPTDLQLPWPAASDTDRAGELSFTLDAALTRRVREAARQASVTPFAVLLTAFAHVLHRHCATDDVVIATPATDRPAAASGVLGCFINTLILRLRLGFGGESTCRDAVRTAGEVVLGALDHASLAFDRLIADLRPTRDAGAGQFLPVMFNYHEAIAMSQVGGLHLEPFTLPRTQAQFDLACTVVDHGEKLDLRLAYAVDANLAGRIGEHLVETLHVLLSNLDASTSALPVTPCGDGDAAPPPKPHYTPVPAIERFERWARRTPHLPAVRCLDEVASYGEVNARANRLARHLVACGIRPRDAVALRLDRSIDLVVAMLAAQKARAIYVPLDPVFPDAHINAVVAQANAKLVLTPEHIEAAEPYPATNLDLPIGPSDPMYTLFTSGSTGRPKGVVVEHQQLSSFLDAMLPLMDLPPRLSYANVTTFAADLGMTNLYGALTTGGLLHVIPYSLATDPGGLADYFTLHPIDFMKTVPTHLQAMNEAGVLGAIMPRRHLVLAGEAFPWELADAARHARPECSIWNHYGPTETTVDVLAYEIDNDRLGATVPIGQPIDRVHIYVVDRRLRPVPEGTPGELIIGGASVARGYLSGGGNAFIPDPHVPGGRCYRTGDRVRVLPGGAIEFLGRIDRQIKIRGYRVEPGHIETTLRRHPRIADAAITARQDPAGRTCLTAYYSPKKLTPKQARAHARAELPDYMVPAAFVALDRLPVTPNGKLDRSKLPEAEPDTTASPTRHDLDERLAEIWCAALGTQTIGIDDDFFELGGDSLLAMRVVRRIGMGLTLVSLFQHPTVRRLADYLGTADASPDRLLVGMTRTKPDTTTATIVAVPFGGGNAAAYHELAQALPSRFPLYTVDLPGHDYGNATQPLAPFDSLAEKAVTEIRATIAGPIVVYGHCVGSALAFAIAQRLDEEGADVAGVVLGAAYPSPHLPGRFFQAWARLMPSDRWKSDRLYKEMLRSIGGFTEAIDPAEQAFIVRALRHDSRGADTYFSHRFAGPTPPRRLRALCVVGERDRITEFYEERHREWDRLGAETDLAVIPDAGHYFLKHQADRLAGEITGWLEHRPASKKSTPAPVVRPGLWRFGIVSFSQLLSMTGTRISAFGLGVWAYLQTGSATTFSVILVCAVLPGLVALPFAGAIVDRWNRRWVMIIGDLIGATGTALCLAMFASGQLRLWHIYLASAVGSVANAFQQPAYLAATAQLVPKHYFARVSGVVQALVALSQTAGPLLGAALIVSAGVGGVLAIDVLTLLLSVATLLAVRFPDLLFRRREESVWKEVTGGMRYIARRRGFVAMNGFFLVYNLILGFAIALTPPIVLSSHSPGMLSLATTIGGIGGVVGGVAMAMWGGFERRATGMVGFCILTGVGMILVGLHPSPLFPIAGLAAIGASIALLNGHWQTLIQNKVGAELQGRMITTNRMVANLTEPVGYLCAGWLADKHFGPMGMMVVLGVAQIAVAAAGLRWRTLRYMEDALPDAIPGPIVTWDRDKLQEEADSAVRRRF